jgi:HPt (histidine-containing phosphotransfer) domain-containing protein
VNRIDDLVRQLGSARVLRLIRDFAAELPDRIQALGEATRRDGFDDLRLTAHALCGGSAALGLTELEEAARAIENCCEDRQYDEARRLTANMFPLQIRALMALATAQGRIDDNGTG